MADDTNTIPLEDVLPPEQLKAARQYYGDDEIRSYLNESARGLAYQRQQRGKAWAGSQADLSNKDYRGVNLDEGAPAWDRFLAGFKSGPEGRYNFYKKRYGDANTRMSPGGEIEFFNPKTSQWHKVDEEGFSLADLADFGGDLPELIGMIAAPQLRGIKGIADVLQAGGNAGKAARIATTPGGGAAAGNILKQTVGQAMPGDESVQFGDPLQAGLLAETANVGGPAIAAAGRPSQMAEGYVLNRLKKAGGTDYAREGLELSQKSGIPLNLAEMTGDDVIKVMLGFAQRSGFGQQLALEQDKAKQMASMAAFARLIERMGVPNAFGREDFAQPAAIAARRSLQDIENRLKGVDYKFLEDYAGATPNIPLTERNRFLQSRADYYRSMGDKQHIGVADELERLINSVPAGPTGDRLGNARLLQQLLQESGQEGYGSLPEKQFPLLAAMQGTKESRDLWKATQADLSNAAEGGNEIARRLLASRRETGELLSAREAMSKTPLLAFLNSKGVLPAIMKRGEATPGVDKAIPAILSGMRAKEGELGKISPTEIGNMVKLMSVANPNIGTTLQHATIADAIKAGYVGSKRKGFDYNAAVKALPDMAYLQAMGANMSTMADLKVILKTIDRIEKFGLGIPHSPGGTVISIGKQLSEGKISNAITQGLSQILIPRGVSSFAFNPESSTRLTQVLNQEPIKNSYWGKFYREALPALLYELGNSAPRENQASVGQ